ncbi:MAG: leucine-rich repeat domain-containing protein [Prevotella sp.]|nr:leucine-rich repeat domain-containing protein [Prevotella sp.]
MKRLLISCICLCALTNIEAIVYYNGLSTKIGDNYYQEFWDDEDESDDVRVELLYWNCAPDTLFVPATIEWDGETAYVDRVDHGFFQNNNLKAVVVDTDNRSLSSQDGLLFSKDGTLLGWPRGKGGVFTIGKDMQLDYWLLNNRPLLTAIEVDEGNTRFSSRNGVLFTKDGLQLLVYPAGKEGAYSVPQGVTTIIGSAFKGCSHLTELQLPETVREIGSSAFEGCSQLRHVNISEGVEELSSYLFAHCTHLEALEIPSTVSYLGYNVFWDCNSLKTINIPASVTKMENSALWFDYGMTDIQVDESNPTYKSIDGIVYSKDGAQLLHCPCGRTGTVTIAEGTTTLDHSFFCCGKLEKVVIPASVETIGESTFSDCYGLRSIYTEREEPVPGKVWVFWPSGNNFWLPSSCTIYVPQGCKEKYQRQDDNNWWSRFWIEEYEPSGIAEAGTSRDNSAASRYNLDGRLATGKRGLKIVRRKNGITRKEICF